MCVCVRVCVVFHFYISSSFTFLSKIQIYMVIFTHQNSYVPVFEGFSNILLKTIRVAAGNSHTPHTLTHW